MSLLTCNEDCSLAEFAQKRQVQLHSLWLPISAAVPSHTGSNATVAVDSHTPMVLLETGTDTLVLDRREICVRLQVANASSSEDTTVLVDPGVMPRDCEVFVRWSRPDGIQLKANMRVLHYNMEEVPSLSSRHSAHSLKRSRVVDEANSVDAFALKRAIRGNQNRLTLAQRSREDLHRRLTAAISTRGCQLHPRSTEILQSTLASICHRLAHPPLHFVLPSDAMALEAGGVTWARSNGRIFSRVFRSTTSEERSEAAKYSDGSRQLRFYFIEDVLLRRPQEWTATAAARYRDDGSGTGGCDRASHEVEVLLKEEVLADMNNFADRGFRIVFIEHYPALHHGSRYMVERTLTPVVRLCLQRCPHLTVTVVISAMSCVTAARKQGMMMSLVLPHTGLLSFFISELNTSLTPDPKTAAVVGSSDRGSLFLKTLHADFARNASLTYVDVRELRHHRE
ncbi:hypothetical protein JKF63_06493 [Porcisia hertigi]|uniref:Uncharacterized protein n=1 Tax=Porcisia hertigi TaxID=2761500 RepID=A0A836LCZ0_9TRYP|nr:hypothetical protein JKF63_06493 [Porcisia hertigi]